LKTSDFDYDLPSEFIAQKPIEPRDKSRLMVLDRKNDTISHSTFKNIGEQLRAGDLLVINETRVIPARLYASKLPGGGQVELLLLRKQDSYSWEAMVGGKGLKEGRRILVDHGPPGEVVSMLDGPRRLIRFEEQIEDYLPSAGHVPLPPYIKEPLEDAGRYQTIYAKEPGSAAAPTAGLHFTQGVIEHLKGQGVSFVSVTLHVGLDTFAPVTADDPRQHTIHTEFCQLSEETAAIINKTRQEGGRIIAVGTTSVRTIESAALHAAKGEFVAAFEGPTDLYILPGYEFLAADGMITNFHLPRSSLIMMVSAFYGRERILEAYEIAKEQGYRFYSFGDAMLIT
jgi:S-adenosylmethionine:tRNA ribosyltransferase-isomerase